jgi:cation transport protein ChaC
MASRKRSVGGDQLRPSKCNDDRGDVQYAGQHSLAKQLRHVLQGHGQSGINRDYVLATVKAIEAEGFRDQQLHRLATKLHDQHRPALPAENSDR